MWDRPYNFYILLTLGPYHMHLSKQRFFIRFHVIISIGIVVGIDQEPLVRKYDAKKRKLPNSSGASLSSGENLGKVLRKALQPIHTDFWKVLPDAPGFVTEDVQDDHISALQKETRLTKPNNGKVNELMKSTYELRRRNILRQVSPIKEIVKKYPPLATCAGVSNSFYIFKKISL